MNSLTHSDERKAYYREYMKRWRAENKSKVKEYNHRYYTKRTTLKAKSLDVLEAELQALKQIPYANRRQG